MSRSVVRLLTAAGALAAVVVAPARATDWPGFRGPTRDAISTEAGLLQEWPASGPPLAWKATGLGVGFSSLAAVGERLYTIGDRDGAQQVLALQRADGSLLWSAKLGDPWNDEYGGGRGTPTVDGELLYAIGTSGNLVCLRRPPARSAGARACPTTSAAP